MLSQWLRSRQSIVENWQPRERRDRDLQHLQHPALPEAQAALHQAAAIAAQAEAHHPAAATAHGAAPHQAAQVAQAVLHQAAAQAHVQYPQVDQPDQILQAMHRSLSVVRMSGAVQALPVVLIAPVSR